MKVITLDFNIKINTCPLQQTFLIEEFKIFEPKLLHFLKNVDFDSQGVVCQVDISVLLMTTELKNIYFIFPKFGCWVLCQPPPLWFQVEIEVPLFLSQTWPDTFEVHI